MKIAMWLFCDKLFVWYSYFHDLNLLPHLTLPVFHFSIAPTFFSSSFPFFYPRRSIICEKENTQDSWQLWNIVEHHTQHQLCFELMFQIHWGKLVQVFSPHPIDPQVSPCYHSFLTVTQSYTSKVTLIGDEINDAVLLYVFKITFPASPFTKCFWTQINYNIGFFVSLL